MAYDPDRDPDHRDPATPDSAEAGPDASPPRRAESRRRRAYDEDEYDDEDDEDDEDEREERRRAAARRARAKRRGARTPKRKLNIPKTEAELNVPKIQTIGMLGSVSVLMIIMWFAAKLACNAHPDHLREPRYVSVDQLARDPKNAALEFQLRLTSKDYLLAGEIASGKVADKIHELLSFCEQNADTCEKERLALKDKVTGTAALIDTTPGRAVVEVTTYISGASPKTVTLDVAPLGQVWKVTQSRDGGALVPAADSVGANQARPSASAAPALAVPVPQEQR